MKKKNPCKPAAVAADEGRQPAGIDDDEYGEEVREREANEYCNLMRIFH
jgi:hypothetical protein